MCSPFVCFILLIIDIVVLIAVVTYNQPPKVKEMPLPNDTDTEQWI